MKRAFILAALTLALGFAPAQAATGAKEPPAVAWSFNGPFGTYDRAALQRGFQVYREVCASCHSLNLLSYRNLGEPGGPFEAHRGRDHETGEVAIMPGPPENSGQRISPIDNPYVKAIAAEYEVVEIDSQTGDEVRRPARPSDRFHAPFANDGMARAANGGSLPPDLSVIARARHGGADYIHAYVIGIADKAPEGLTVDPGKYYNPYFHGDLSSFWTGDPRHVPPGGLVAMAPQLTPDRVTYSDGTSATPDQMSRDVATFLAWAADPHVEKRKQLGVEVMIYLLILTSLTYLAYRQVWKNVAH